MGRTFRIQGIRPGISEKDFCARLAEVYSLDEFATISLVPKEPGKEQVATVSFENGVPKKFQEVKPCEKIYPNMQSLGGEITIDCDFDGMTPLYSDKDPHVDIVAITGLSAHAFASWKSPDREKMWLRDFLPKDLSGTSKIRVLVFGYTSRIIGSTSSSSIKQFARNLLDLVSGIRPDKARKRPIVFIGYSLGGLVIKQALVDAYTQQSPNDKAILDSCVGLFFFGVPNKGLNNENMMNMVEGQNTEQLIRDLALDSPLLQQSYESFLKIFTDSYSDCQITSFYETHDSPIRKFNEEKKRWEKSEDMIRMVPISSATWASTSEKLHNQVPIETDHYMLVKYLDKHDPNYNVVRDRIEAIVKQAPKMIEARLKKFNPQNITTRSATTPSSSSTVAIYPLRRALTTPLQRAPPQKTPTTPPTNNSLPNFNQEIKDCETKIQQHKQTIKTLGETMVKKQKLLGQAKDSNRRGVYEMEITDLKNKKARLIEQKQIVHKRKEKLQQQRR